MHQGNTYTKRINVKISGDTKRERERERKPVEITQGTWRQSTSKIARLEMQ